MKSKDQVYAFIDSQNLNLGVKSQGWKLDWRKFRQYLKNKYKVSKSYILIFKPTLEHKVNNKIVIKGNVDAELVLHSMIQLNNYKKAIIVSGDGDFHCLIEYLVSKNKLLKILTPTSRYSSLLRHFNTNNLISRIDLLKNSLEQKKDWHSRSAETLG